MSTGTRITNDDGVVITNGTSGLSVERDGSNYGFSPFQVYSTKALTTSTTLEAGDAGLITATGAGVVVKMPSASLVPGATYTVRLLSADATVITGSEVAGTNYFAAPAGTTAYTLERGQSITIAAAIGNSVTMLCDGRNYLVLGGSGSLVIGA